MLDPVEIARRAENTPNRRRPSKSTIQVALREVASLYRNPPDGWEMNEAVASRFMIEGRFYEGN